MQVPSHQWQRPRGQHHHGQPVGVPATYRPHTRGGRLRREQGSVSVEAAGEVARLGRPECLLREMWTFFLVAVRSGGHKDFGTTPRWRHTTTSEVAPVGILLPMTVQDLWGAKDNCSTEAVPVY